MNIGVTGAGRKGSKRRGISGAAAFLLLLAFSFTGCGYHVAGKGGAMPGGIKTMSIPFFQNFTRRPDVERVLTTALVDEFINTPSLRIVKSGEGEATLLGSIRSYALTPISFDSSDVTQEYRLTLVVELKLVAGEKGRVLWKREGLSDYEDFKVTALNVDATKAAEREALKKMVKDMARLIKEQMVEDF